MQNLVGNEAGDGLVAFHFFLIKAFHGSLMALLISAEFTEGLFMFTERSSFDFLTTLGPLFYTGQLFEGRVGCIQTHLSVFKSIKMQLASNEGVQEL